LGGGVKPFLLLEMLMNHSERGGSMKRNQSDGLILIVSGCNPNIASTLNDTIPRRKGPRLVEKLVSVAYSLKPGMTSWGRKPKLFFH
jgi:hypothetical protein